MSVVQGLPLSPPPSSRPNQLILLTTASPDLSVCAAIGERLLGATGSLLSLVCGLPSTAGARALLPLCTALRARRLLLHSDSDPDVAALRESRRDVRYPMAASLVECCSTLMCSATSTLRELTEKVPALRDVAFDSSSLNAFIKTSVPKDDRALFWSLFGCFCARRLLDYAEDIEPRLFDAFLAKVATDMKMKLAFQNNAALQQAMRAREQLTAAITAVDSAQRAAVSESLNVALSLGLGRRVPDPGASRHALLLVKQQKRAHSLLTSCETALQDKGVELVEVTAEMEPAHIQNWLQRRGPSSAGGTMLLVMTHGKLLQFASGPGALTSFPWNSFALVRESTES